MITLDGNHAVAMWSVAKGAALTLEDLTIANTRAQCRGAISNAGTLTMTNSTFSDNGVAGCMEPSLGGAISNFGTLTVTNSTFSGNRADNGGAIYNDNGTLTVTNSTFSGNSADDGGGAIDNLGTRATLTNSIIANSTSGGNCVGAITDGGRNLDSDGTCGVGPATDPLLDPAGLADNGGPTQTVALQAGSPAINAGDPEVCANRPVYGLDQRGFVRPGEDHTQCSIGAYKADAIPVAMCIGDGNDNGAVAINELILGVNILLGIQPEGACPAFMNSERMMDIAQFIKGVNNSLRGCGTSRLP